MLHSNKVSNKVFGELRQAGTKGLFGLGEEALGVLLYQAARRLCAAGRRSTLAQGRSAPLSRDERRQGQHRQQDDCVRDQPR